MGIGSKLQASLLEFEEKTEGILGSCVILSSQALMMAEASNHFDRSIIQGMSEKLMRLSREVIEMLIQNAGLQSVTIEENNHFVYVRKVNPEYHVVVITDKSELSGLRDVNIKGLISRLNEILTK
ncbi:MAG: hypothetical protein HeimC2_15870 [Candidatus Heimdallarchaeota archaeon LC_2]|nr:MAG: hypothetical protein HeimC2_15870 [Candidatus Heimdallarchaeota archaeon LC_2]